MSFTAGMISHTRNTDKLIGMYMMIVAEMNKAVTSEVPVLPGSSNTYTLQRKSLDPGLLFSDPALELNKLFGFFSQIPVY